MLDQILYSEVNKQIFNIMFPQLWDSTSLTYLLPHHARIVSEVLTLAWWESRYVSEVLSHSCGKP